MTSVECMEQPMSRTYQYRKVMKPLLERKRRARINRCLDELKELMVGALQSEGENVAKLEKADVLELTVKYLRKLKLQNRLGTCVPESTSPVPPVDRFRAGFTQCATEVSKCLTTIPGLDVSLGTRLMTHLGHCVNQLDVTVQQPKCPDTPPMSPVGAGSGGGPVTLAPPAQLFHHLRHTYASPAPAYLLTPVSADEDAASERVWRPW
ncbi:unnamed protein product [Notodromas monacha]|uniref:Uncharacterized protein n=1 Tax=Notodromas monacha TaxID=399045 RepID=A0A7R9BDT5_9CRUS|nr:unnamed protein product [Notodromas monacha]CAG0912614.1 unnamed protein product [Notodromas monacha]